MMYTAYKKIFGITDAPNRPQYTLLCLGHGGSGKSTLLAVLMQEDLEEVESPTKGFAIKAAALSGVVFNCKELGGSQKYRKYWSRYYDENDGVLYVIDASVSRAEIGASIETLYSILEEQRLGNCPTLLLINKLDAEGSQPYTEVRGMIDESRLKGRRFAIAGCSTNDRASIAKAFEDFANENFETVSDLLQSQ